MKTPDSHSEAPSTRGSSPGGDSYRPQRQDVALRLFEGSVKQASISNIDNLALTEACLAACFVAGGSYFHTFASKSWGIFFFKISLSSQT